MTFAVDWAFKKHSYLSIYRSISLYLAIRPTPRTLVPKDAERHWDVNLILFLSKPLHLATFHPGLTARSFRGLDGVQEVQCTGASLPHKHKHNTVLD